MTKAPDVIHTARLRLRKPVAADAEAIFANYASDSDVTRFMDWPTHISVENTRTFLQFAQADWQNNPAGTFLVELDGCIVGSSGIHFGRAGAVEASAETGYVFARQVWGRGYATEVLHAMVLLAAKLELQQLTAGCHPDNFASQRVLEKCGFRAATAHSQPRVFPNAGSAKVAALHYWRRIA